MGYNEPKYKQIANKIKGKIEDGILKPDAALPSINSYANANNYNRSTVERAYKLLCNEGYVVALQGKGYFVVQHEALEQEFQSSKMRVFWSYSHKDDERSGYAITTLRKQIQAEYELQTGDEASIFQDTKDLKWGMDWRKTISEALGTTTFFIPILTPTYLRSASCMAELRTAISRFEELGFSEGIYPIEFVDCAKAINVYQDDSIAMMLSDTQRKRNWISLRYEDPHSVAYRKEVAAIVSELLEHEKDWEKVSDHLKEREESKENDEDGALERVAELEEALEHLSSLRKKITIDITDIGGAFNSESISKNGGARKAIAEAAKLARRLDSPSKSLERHCNEYDTCLQNADRGIDGIIEFYTILKDINSESAEGLNLDSLSEQISSVLESTRGTFEQMDELRIILQNFSRIARPLRRPCERINAGISQIGRSELIMSSWKSKIDSTLELSVSDTSHGRGDTI